MQIIGQYTINEPRKQISMLPFAMNLQILVIPRIQEVVEFFFEITMPLLTFGIYAF